MSFGAVDKRGNWLLSLMVYGLYGLLFLTALNRLPIKLPAKGTGRKHRGGGGARNGGAAGEGAKKGGGGSAVLFADVAGVDEAKEELQEIVVGSCLGWWAFEVLRREGADLVVAGLAVGCSSPSS